MGKLRIAATADLHYGKHSRGVMHDAFAEISRRADMLLLCGDMTDYGLAEEAEELVADLHSGLRIPALAVLGNHDLESGEGKLIEKVLDQAGVERSRGSASNEPAIRWRRLPPTDRCTLEEVSER